MISYSKKFIFIHIPKTGGNSIQTLLHPYSDDNYGIDPSKSGNQLFKWNESLGTRKHSSLWEYKKLLPTQDFQAMFTFSILRNPWDRVISHFFSLRKSVSKWDRDRFLHVLHRIRPAEDYLCVDSPLVRKLSMAVQKNNPCFEKMNMILKFESLEKDYRVLCDRINVPFAPLPVVNQSQHDHYSVYYDPELVEIVRRKFKAEITWGQYDFEPQIGH